MPTYEYNCKKCNKDFEVVQSFSDDPLKLCPQCGSEVHRIITGGSGVIFKGGGFYSTDTANSKMGKAEKPCEGGAPSTVAPSTAATAPSTTAPSCASSCPHAQTHGGAAPPCCKP